MKTWPIFYYKNSEYVLLIGEFNDLVGRKKNDESHIVKLEKERQIIVVNH